MNYHSCGRRNVLLTFEKTERSSEHEDGKGSNCREKNGEASSENVGAAMHQKKAQQEGLGPVWASRSSQVTREVVSEK